MDERDVEILKTIADTGDPSPKAIEAATGIPKSTVHYRIEKLRDQGVIEDDLYSIDITALGLDLTIISEVTATYREGYHEEVGRKLSAIEGVSQVYFTMGDTDFIVVANLADRTMVEDLIAAYERIDEVERTSSSFTITTIKDERTPLRNYDLETLVDLVSEESSR